MLKVGKQRCKNCNSIKNINGFYVEIRNRSGITRTCKECHKATTASYYIESLDKVKKEKREYNLRSAELIKEGKKHCKSCDLILDLSMFAKELRNKSGLAATCKLCTRIRLKNNYIVNKNKYQLKQKERYYPGKDSARGKKYRDSNKDKTRERNKSYKQSERGKKLHCASSNKRRASKLLATPKWLSIEQLEQIKKIYLNCPKGQHVDHIIPLRGNTVRGLHVPWNLQYLPAKENMSKGNSLLLRGINL